MAVQRQQYGAQMRGNNTAASPGAYAGQRYAAPIVQPGAFVPRAQTPSRTPAGSVSRRQSPARLQDNIKDARASSPSRAPAIGQAVFLDRSTLPPPRNPDVSANMRGTVGIEQPALSRRLTREEMLRDGALVESGASPLVLQGTAAVSRGLSIAGMCSAVPRASGQLTPGIVLNPGVGSERFWAANQRDGVGPQVWRADDGLGPRVWQPDPDTLLASTGSSQIQIQHQIAAYIDPALCRSDIGPTMQHVQRIESTIAAAADALRQLPLSARTGLQTPPVSTADRLGLSSPHPKVNPLFQATDAHERQHLATAHQDDVLGLSHRTQNGAETFGGSAAATDIRRKWNGVEWILMESAAATEEPTPGSLRAQKNLEKTLEAERRLSAKLRQKVDDLEAQSATRGPGDSQEVIAELEDALRSEQAATTELQHRLALAESLAQAASEQGQQQPGGVDSERMQQLENGYFAECEEAEKLRGLLGHYEQFFDSHNPGYADEQQDEFARLSGTGQHT